MLTITWMYMKSGGADYKHECKECKHCTEGDTSENKAFGKRKFYVCDKHPEKPEWKPSWCACRWYDDGKAKTKPAKKSVPKKDAAAKTVEYKQEPNGQLSFV